MVTYVGTLAADSHSGTENIMYGLDGDDFLEVNGNSFAILYGGEGNDNLNFLDGTNSGGDIYGGSGNDYIDGDAIVDINDDMYGDEGNDTVSSYGGSDSLYGGQGNDFLSAGDGADELYGGQDNDVLDAGAENDYLDGGQGTDRLDGGLGDDVLYGADGDDSNTTISVGTGSSSFTAGLYGGGGNDYLDGGRGNDYLDGGSDDDILLGGEGNDRLIGGTGIDRMTGGAGNDYYQIDNAADVIEEFKGGDTSGKDTVATLVSYQLREGVSVEKFATATTSSTTAINLVGNEIDQAILGNNGVNKIYGRLGNDTLTGNGGNDAFIFDTKLSASANVDRITDFSNFFGNDDTIRLDDAIFTDLSLGALNASFFKANSAGVATDSNDRIVYNTSTGALYYDTNGNTAGGAVQFAILSTQPLITASDFLIV